MKKEQVENLSPSLSPDSTPSAFTVSFRDGVTAYKKRDYKTAVREFSTAAKQGHAGALYNLGFMFSQGIGVSKDCIKTAKLFRLAAKQGHARSQYNLGEMYRQGKGVSQDYIQAMKWYLLAAKQGHAGARNNLGIMHARGEGVTQDYVKAHMWLNLATTQGHEKAKEVRDLIAEQMTPAQIAGAKELTRMWFEKQKE